MESKVYENVDDYMETDDVATLLVRLYADYVHKCNDGFHNKGYAKAVGIAIRMLTD